MATVLCDPELEAKQFIHPTNKDRRGGIRLFKDEVEDTPDLKKCYRRIYPDFYRDGMIVDAKYKRLEQGLVRDDLYQIISYMHTMRISVGGFLYPHPSTVDECEAVTAAHPTTYRLAGYGGTIFVQGLPIPQDAPTYDQFKGFMKDREEELLKAIEEMPREGAEFHP